MQKSLFLGKYLLIFLQFTLVAIVAIICALIKGWIGLKSAILGGVAWTLPSVYFVWNQYRTRALFDTKNIVKHFFLGGAIKMLLCIITIMLILSTTIVNSALFLAGFATAVFSSALAPFWQARIDGRS